MILFIIGSVSIGLFLGFSNNILQLDAPTPWQIGFQDGASPGFEGILTLHDSIMFYLIWILVSVFWVLMSLISYFSSNKSTLVYKYLNHGTLIELIWTISPALVLIAIAFPSFKLLYTLDEVIDPALTVKVTGLFFPLRVGGLKLYILNKKINTNLINKKNNMCYQVVQTKNRFNISSLLGYIQPRNLFKFNIQNNKQRYYHINNIRSKNRIGPHNLDIISVIIGSLLGDAYANNRSGEGVRICYRQSIIHKEYLFWLYNFFYTRGYASNLPPRQYSRIIKSKPGIIYYGFEFNTFTFTSFNWIHKMFYKNGIKKIPFNIGEYLTPLALAVWISDDGGWANHGIRIATNSFQLKDIELLSKVLKSKYNLDTTIQKLSGKDLYSLYIKKQSINDIRELLLPYMHPSMLFKLGIDNTI